jgi:hypothetical protein
MYRSFHAIVAALLVLAVVIGGLALLSEHGREMVSNDQPAAGSSGIARPHPPLDRAPGQPLKEPLKLPEPPNPAGTPL